MGKRNLTKEEMSEYIKVTNFLANNESDINSILARDRDEFNKGGLYSNTNWKMDNTLRAFYFSSITTIMLFIPLVIVFGPMNIVPYVLLFFFFSFCPFLIIFLSLSHSTKKKFLKINELCLKEKIFYPNTYLQNTLSEKDYKTYFKLKAFFDYLVRIGYYNNYLTPEEVGRIRKIEKEREDISEKVKKSTEPIEKEFWEMKLKNFEKENSKYLNLKGDKEYA